MKKLFIATVAGAATMFAIGGLAHLVIFKDLIQSLNGSSASVNRPETLIQFTILALLILAFIMSYMYPKGVQGDNKIMQGLKFGLIVSVLWFLPCNLIEYSMTTRLSLNSILFDIVLHAIEQGTGGIVIALVYGNLPLKS